MHVDLIFLPKFCLIFFLKQIIYNVANITMRRTYIII